MPDIGKASRIRRTSSSGEEQIISFLQDSKVFTTPGAKLQEIRQSDDNLNTMYLKKCHDTDKEARNVLEQMVTQKLSDEFKWTRPRLDN